MDSLRVLFLIRCVIIYVMDGGIMREQLSLEQFEVKKNIMQQLNEEQFNYFL